MNKELESLVKKITYFKTRKERVAEAKRIISARKAWNEFWHGKCKGMKTHES